MDQAVSDVSPRVPAVRSPGFKFDASIPRHWFGGNVVATHVANGVNLLFPAGERFFVRSVNHYLPRITDPVLRAQVKGFFGQEGKHAHEHERVFEVLEAQGYNVRRFLKLYERIAFGFLEKIAPHSLRLATTAACEHYTAIMAEDVLTTGVMDTAHPEMKGLLLWHACEEIEHRAVAFDVLKQVAPGYGVRMAGMVLATTLLAGFWMMSTIALLAQERDIPFKQMRADFAAERSVHKEEEVFIRGIKGYLRKDFHPLQHDTDALAQAYLAGVGLA